MSELTAHLPVLARRFPVAAAWLVGRPLGVATTLGYLAFEFFNWLDRNAPVESRRSISRWIRDSTYPTTLVRSEILAIFDRLYSLPLLQWKAFFISAGISSVFTVPWFFFYWTSRIPAIDQAIFDSIFWFAIILSDYLSLFVVRRFLSVGGPIQSLFLGAIAGVLVVTTFFAVAILLTSLVIEMIYASRFSLSGYIHYGLPPIIEFLINNANQLSGRIMYPACLVHVWLLLFAVGAMGARLMNTMLHAIGYAQWLIRQGDQHPLRAVGLVAAIIVFIGVLTYDYVRDG